MTKSGQITVFLSLVLACICSLLLLTAESARMAGARCLFRMAAGSALDSVMSRYHKEIWDQYRILILEKENEEIRQDAQQFIESYLDMEDFYAVSLEEIKVEQTVKITDNGGHWLEQEILDYMKYGIWQLEWEEFEAEGIMDSLKEAAAVKGYSDLLKSCTREALKLEKITDKICRIVEDQREELENLNQSVGNESRTGVKKAVQQLGRDSKKLPPLVESYESQAVRLREEVNDVRIRGQEKFWDMTSSTKDAMESELSFYEDYVDQGGQRYQEIVGLVRDTDYNMQVLDRVDSLVSEAESQGSFNEETGEYDDPDVTWADVGSAAGRFRQAGLSFGREKGDLEKSDLLEQVKELAASGVLGLLLGADARISDGKIADKNLPSGLERGEIPSFGLGTQVLSALMMNEYIMEFFTLYGEESAKDLQYEVEYILSGGLADKENLAAAAGKLIALREGLNLLYLLTDAGKRQEARALASVIAGGTGVVPLIPVLSFFILAVWALGEALVDVRHLLNGEKAVLWKTSGTWELSLEGLLDLGKTGKISEGAGQDKGFTYESYMKLLLLMTPREDKCYRIMDMMQVNIQMRQQDFLMARGCYRVDIRVKANGKHGINIAGGVDHYKLEAALAKAY